MARPRENHAILLMIDECASVTALDGSVVGIAMRFPAGFGVPATVPWFHDGVRGVFRVETPTRGGSPHFSSTEGQLSEAPRELLFGEKKIVLSNKEQGSRLLREPHRNALSLRLT